MTILQEYRNSLKMAEVEEPLDLVCYRPIAYGFVKLIYRLPITPNQVTYLSLLAGLLSAFYFARGTAAGYLAAALWYAAANILDCSDGMLARLQGSGTPLGRLLDGIVDWVIGVAVFIGLGIGLQASTGDPGVWYLVVGAGVSSAMHALVFDIHQQDYLSHVRGTVSFLPQELEKVRGQLRRLEENGGPWWRRAVLTIYLQYMKLQERIQARQESQRQYPAEIFRSHNRRTMRMWTLLGSTTNRSLLILTSLFHVPAVFLWTVLIAGNFFLVVMLLRQRSVRRRMAALAE